MPPGRRNRRVDQEEHQAGEVEVLGHAEDNAAYQEAIDKEVHVMAEDVVSADQIGANTVSNETTAQGELAGLTKFGCIEYKYNIWPWESTS